MEEATVESSLLTADEGRPGSSDVSDACDELKVAVRTGALQPLWPECPSLAGRLRTVRLEPAEGAPTPLPELLDLLAQARGQVVLVDLGGRTDCQCWGSVLATAALQFGVNGALVNGSARDVDALRSLGFPVYARGVYPGAIRGRLRLAAVDEPVDLDGSLVEPGSLAVVDSSGTVVVPAAHADEVTALAAKRLAREREQLQAVAAGADPRTVFLAEPGARQES
jgi:regulator of RNase E activity RraA